MAKLLVGIVRKPHGIHGGVKVHAYTDDLDAFCRYPAFEIEGVPRRVLQVTRMPDGPMMQFSGVSTREAAEALRGKSLYIPRELVSGDAPLVEDYIGLRVVLKPGTSPVARIDAYVEGGTGGLFEVRRNDGVAFLVPVTRELWGLPDATSRTVHLRDPEGFYLS